MQYYVSWEESFSPWCHLSTLSSPEISRVLSDLWPLVHAGLCCCYLHEFFIFHSSSVIFVCLLGILRSLSAALAPHWSKRNSLWLPKAHQPPVPALPKQHSLTPSAFCSHDSTWHLAKAITLLAEIYTNCFPSDSPFPQAWSMLFCATWKSQRCSSNLLNAQVIQYD